MNNSIGVFAGKRLYLIVSKYVNGNLALILITDNHVEFAYITKYVSNSILKNKYQIILNPNIPKELRIFLEKKKIISKTKSIIKVGYNTYEQVDINYSAIKYYDPSGTKVFFD